MKKETQATESISLNGMDLNYQLIRSKKRRSSLMMKLAKDGVLQLRVPYLVSDSEINKFLFSKKNWISKQLQKYSSIQTDIGFLNGDYQLYKGKKYKIELVKSTQPKVYLKDSHFYVFSNKINLKSNLESWFKTESLNYFTTRTFELAQQHGFDKLTAIKVRKMRSSWGNCRSNGLITFNYNLIKAPIELIDYVIIHELCHLLQPNHSNKFYQLQASILPHWKQLKSQLDQMAASII